MKFIASSAELFNRLSIISRVISSKPSIPILDHFLFNVKNGSLEMTASDNETTIVTSMPIEGVEGNGSIAVRSGIMLSTLKEFADQPLTFDINTDNLSIVISSETGHYEFNGDSADQYIFIPTPGEGCKLVTIEASDFLNAIEKTSFATATEESRPMMTGIYFDITSDMVTSVATDAHKMARFRNRGVQGFEVGNFILAKKPTSLLKSMLVKEEGSADIQYDEKNIFVSTHNYRLICHQIEGSKYPNYNSVIPTNNTCKLLIRKNEFISILKRVSIYSNQASNLIRLQLRENMVVVSAQDLDYSNSAEDHLPCQYDGPEMEIGFKSNFLIEMLNNIDTEEVQIDLSDPSKAALLFPYSTDDEEQTIDILMLLMPVML